MTKQELFRKVLARDFTLREVIYDYELIEQMKARDWIFSTFTSESMPYKCMHSKYHPEIKSGGYEWQQDVIDSLRSLGRI